MQVSRIVAEIDAQIAKLQQARALLSEAGSATVKSGPGRPKGSRNVASAKAAPAAKPASAKPAKKRKLSPEGRKRIADAMKRRWAERRKQTAAAK